VQLDHVPDDSAWIPSERFLRESRVAAFADRHGLATLAELRARSIAEPEWFWDAVVDELGLRFDTPYERVLDDSAGIAWSRWFRGGRLNAATWCCDRWAAETTTATAVVWEGEGGEVIEWTFAHLREQADAAAAHLADLGVGTGDAVGIFCPMVPEAIAAILGVAKLGALFVPVFSGYGAEAIALRLADSDARVLITADGFSRRGSMVDMLSTARDAAQRAGVAHLVVIPRIGVALDPDRGETPWPATGGVVFDTTQVDSEHPLFLAYTSGTTGKPKGSVHVHGGAVVKIAQEGAFQFDIGPSDRLHWFTDMGWIMGPWELIAALANGAAVCLFEGAPDYPTSDRLWAYLARHRVTILGISPTLIRALMANGADEVARHDLSALRVLGSTGEPWNEDPWWWYFTEVGKRRCPVINISGGTEVGACFLSPHPVEPIAPMSLGGPCLGVAVDVFDESGKPVRGEVGELVCTRPWPGMTRGLWRDPQRFIETYWSRWPDVWVHGDWASIDGEGRWFLHGRSDDTIKVAGKRLGPAEAESVLVHHDAVLEAAAVGIPDERKGEGLWCFVVLAGGHEPSEELRADLRAHVARGLGKAFAPSAVKFVRALPKTRNAKVLRRAIRAVVTGDGLGDLSSLEDPTTLDAIRQAR
jgi:acetyl-CoA synthetase